jgi:ribosomal protein L19E
MFVTVLFMVAKKVKRAQYPSTEQWIDKMFYVRNTIQSLKRNGVLLYATT